VTAALRVPAGAGRSLATISRSARLFRAFLREQSDPDFFYQMLAADSVQQLRQFTELNHATMVDVGGGPGYFAVAFRGAGAHYFAVDPDLGELSARFTPGPGTVLGSGTALPFCDNAVDVCYSSNVLEHVADPERMVGEMLRITRPNGIVYVSYTTWLSPWGGHETSPWHYLGGAYAARRFRRVRGRAPKNEYGRTLFAVSAGRMLRWARSQPGAVLVRALPRYHPWWLYWTVRVPGVREIATWNVVLVLRKT
jgi:SAM-dependent methyltransferase